MGRPKGIRLASLSKTKTKPLKTATLRLPGAKSKSVKAAKMKLRDIIPTTITIIEGHGKDAEEFTDIETAGMIAVLNNEGKHDFYDGKWIYKYSRALKKHILHENK